MPFKPVFPNYRKPKAMPSILKKKKKVAPLKKTVKPAPMPTRGAGKYKDPSMGIVPPRRKTVKPVPMPTKMPSVSKGGKKKK
jgi:hypothetical protein